MLAHHQDCFAALQKADVSLDRRSEEAIHQLIYGFEYFWMAHGLKHDYDQHRVKQKILILQFLAGPHFEALSMSSDGQSYKHLCGEKTYRLSTLEEMIHHIETQHHRREMATKVISASTQTVDATYVEFAAPMVNPSNAHIITNDTNGTSSFRDPGLKVIIDYLDTLKIVKADDDFISLLKDKFKYSCKGFFDRFSTHADVIATLHSFDIPFGQYRNFKYNIVQHIAGLLQIKERGLDPLKFTEIIQLVYIAGQGFDRLQLIRPKESNPAYRFFDPEHMTSAIEFNNENALGRLFQLTQTHEIAKENAGGLVPAMTLYRRLHHAVPRDHNKNVDVEVIGPPSQRTSMAKRVYMYRETVVSHMPIFLYLQQNKVEVPQNDVEKQEKFISDLQDLFPTISQQCGSCGSFSRDYRDHLQVIVSIHQVGRENLRHIRLRGSEECFEHCTPGTGKWTLIKDPRALKKLAGFILPPPKKKEPKLPRRP